MGQAAEQRQALTDKELDGALQTCSDEQIHIPGSIQPHGFMLILDDAFNIKKFSLNLAQFLEQNPRYLLNLNLDTLVDADKIEELKQLTSQGALNPIRSTLLSLKVNSETHHFDAIIHKSGAFFVLELEPQRETTLSILRQDFYRDIMTFSTNLQKIESQEALFDYVVHEVRRITGFSRIKLYRFDELWNGQVVAESKEEHMSSYMGLHFPHSDIPKQARALYARNYLRLIPDISYQPSALFPDDLDDSQKPIDLSFSALRSVSPVHLQYLENMGIMASMSISIMQNSKLWGLIACHHHEPNFVSYNVRMAAELVGHTFSSFLSTLQQSDETIEVIEKKAYVNEIMGVFTPNATLMHVLKDKYEMLIKAVNADGLVVYVDGKHFAFGLIPDTAFTDSLIKWLEENFNQEVFASTSIMRDTDLGLPQKALTSGVLAVPVSTNMVDYVVWFREGQARQIEWAGKPEKNITKTESGYHLTPRASFERWKQESRYVSKPWSEIDIENGKTIAKILLTKKYEDKLRQKNDDLNSILNNLNAIIYIIDTEGRILNANNTALKLFDYAKEDILGQHFSEVFEGELAGLIDKNSKVVFSTQDSITVEKDFVFKNKNFHLISIKFPLYDQNEDIYALCTIATDISRLRDTEAELIESNKELERMAFIASHDLQEPLRIISNFTQRLERDYGEQLDEKAKKYIDFTVDAAKRMNNLISDLLAYSRLSQEKHEPQLINTQKEIDVLVKQCEVTMEGQDIEISCETRMPEIYMEPGHFSCVMQNFISNGLKYRHPERKPQIVISYEDRTREWVFCVKDNGIGIKKKYFEKIFELFQRLHTSQDYPGTGIGLALCERIIDGYKGKIWLDSEYGEGSWFYFSIPKVQS
ncbi:MAG: ATP-binding protein [Pseudomonadota bacterium]